MPAIEENGPPGPTGASCSTLWPAKSQHKGRLSVVDASPFQPAQKRLGAQK